MTLKMNGMVECLIMLYGMEVLKQNDEHMYKNWVDTLKLPKEEIKNPLTGCLQAEIITS